MKKDSLKKIVLEQHSERERYEQELREKLIERTLLSQVVKDNSKLVVVISGIRRVGKSTLLNEIRFQNKENKYFIDFDDERLLNFSVSDFEKLEEVFLELYGEEKIFYFDEIQNVVGWERFVRRLHNERKKVFVTGSNAEMLSKELGTRLTGRYLEWRLYPFSFEEFMNFRNINLKIKNSIILKGEKVKLVNAFENYFLEGGLPEYLEMRNKKYLDMLYESVLYRDIVARYDIDNEKPLKELVHFCASNIGKKISFNSLTKIIGVKNPTTVKKYFDHLENSFLMFLLPKYDYSFKKQIQANKKVYFIDNALAESIGFRFSQDKGRFLENIVFLELKRREKEIFYFQDKCECDFVVKQGTKIIEAIQVTEGLHDENKKREIDGLLETMDIFNLKSGIIITRDEEGEIQKDNKKITIVPIWKWIL